MPARISNIPLPHPQESTGFRVDVGEGSFVFATDTEHAAEGLNDQLVEFAHATDVLIYDAQYTPNEYENGKAGILPKEASEVPEELWGH